MPEATALRTPALRMRHLKPFGIQPRKPAAIISAPASQGAPAKAKHDFSGLAGRLLMISIRNAER